MKHKTNKRVTQKERILINDNSINREGLNNLISRPFKGNRAQLFKTLVCSYVRIAMADEKNGERLTLDFDLSFNDPDQTRLKQLDQVLIAEVKRSNVKASSRFMELMDQFQHKPVSFSKYCIGCALLHPEKIKTNRFKATLMALDRISRERTLPEALENNILN